MLRLSVSLVAFTCFACAAAQEPVEAPKRQDEPKAQAPTRQLSPEELPGLEVSEISPVVLARYSAVGGCHTIEYSGQTDTAGSVTVDWVIQPDGSVKSAEVTESSFSNDQFHDCVVAVTRNLQFPEAPGTTPVSWRFKFRNRTDAHGNERATLR